jgi:hypothetical protein
MWIRKPPMKIYLAGPMNYLPEFNYPAFDKAAKRLRAAGHIVFNPADNDRDKGYSQEIADAGGKVSPALKRRIIQDDLLWIINEADAIAFLPGWDGSTIPPAAELQPEMLPGLKCTWMTRAGGNPGTGEYVCTWDGSGGARIENALAEWLGGFARINIPREWIV